MNKKEQLQNKLITVIKEFVDTEGGITIADLEDLFGFRGQHEFASALQERIAPIKIL